MEEEDGDTPMLLFLNEEGFSEPISREILYLAVVVAAS